MSWEHRFRWRAVDWDRRTLLFSKRECEDLMALCRSQPSLGNPRILRIRLEPAFLILECCEQRHLAVFRRLDGYRLNAGPSGTRQIPRKMPGFVIHEYHAKTHCLSFRPEKGFSLRDRFIQRGSSAKHVLAVRLNIPSGEIGYEGM